jgi:hypothetical protein
VEALNAVIENCVAQSDQANPSKADVCERQQGAEDANSWRLKVSDVLHGGPAGQRQLAAILGEA